MNINYGRKILLASLTLAIAIGFGTAKNGFSAEQKDNRRFIQVTAKNKVERSAIASKGVSIEAVLSDSIWGFATPESIQDLKDSKIQILGNFDLGVARGGHETMFGFPTGDERFHDYQETLQTMQALVTQNPELATLVSLGKSRENRDLWAIHINSDPAARQTGQSNKPAAVYLGTHHAREHVSTEIPLMFATHLLANKADPTIQNLLENRDIWIVPMVNPDGVEYDIQTGNYRMWRKNRARNSDGTFGVDLNRNYDYHWGETGGATSNRPGDETYHGPSAFSEPETAAIRDFVNAHSNIKILLSFHTFSELVLYPWGYTYDPLSNTRDQQVFETMANTMAGWNGYTPQQSSDLYTASGDTTDWAYGEKGIFAFTFELSPRSMWQGGFYPGARVIDQVFQANLRPCMYLLDSADDPYKVLNTSPAPFLSNLMEPTMPYAQMWDRYSTVK